VLEVLKEIKPLKATVDIEMLEGVSQNDDFVPLVGLSVPLWHSRTNRIVLTLAQAFDRLGPFNKTAGSGATVQTPFTWLPNCESVGRDRLSGRPCRRMLLVSYHPGASSPHISHVLLVSYWRVVL
jgi:hypothetical protein